jgi:hypothetical protein
MAHFTQQQRYTIAQMKKNGFPRKEICKVIGKDKSGLCIGRTDLSVYLGRQEKRRRFAYLSA